MLKRLLGSRKAFVVLLVTGASFVALFSGKATWNEIAELLKWMIGPWLVASGVEDAARHVASGMRGYSFGENEFERTHDPAKDSTGTRSPS